MNQQPAAAWDGEKDYQRFRGAVGASWKAVTALADHLRSQGLTVQIPPLSLCPNYAERNNGFGDAHDLSVLTHYEVKWHDFDFTCAADYPYRDVIVDRKNKLDKVGATVAGWWALNRHLTHVLLIRRSTRDKWFVRKVRDSVKGFEFDAYWIAKEFVEFKALNAPAQEGTA